MINDHPDLDGRYMRWCYHENIHEVDYTMMTNVSYSIVLMCEDCADWVPKEKAGEWLPKLIGTRVDG